MERILQYKITEQEQHKTIHGYLKEQGFSSRSLIELKKDTGAVAVNEQPVFMNHLLTPGEQLTLIIREEPSAQASPKILPVELPLDIVYEDEDLLVINKAAGMPIHPSLNNYDNSVANALAWYYGSQNIPFVFRCINRLDKDTSGLTMIAKHKVSAGILGSCMAARAFAASAGRNAGSMDFFRSDADRAASDRTVFHDTHVISREYLAIVRGSLTPACGVITAPIARKDSSLIERQVDFEKGESAVTHYRLLGEKNGHSLVSLKLETGRTHQIRVHMKYIGFPLIGDYLYNPDMEHISRQALHSYRLSFPHPITGRQMEFAAPLPEDMRRVLKE